jgi:hypothetical protein
MFKFLKSLFGKKAKPVAKTAKVAKPTVAATTTTTDTPAVKK